MGAKEYKLFSVIKPNRLFDNIPESQLSFKISQKDFVNFEEGDIIFQSGDQADIIYLIVEGRVKIKYNANVDGQRYFEKSDQEFFGEREFIQGINRSSSAVAETPVRAFVMTKDVVNQLIQKNPELLHNLQAIDPMKDVARFGMTTQFHSDEFDALMRSVKQSAGGDPYSTTESMLINPDMVPESSYQVPDLPYQIPEEPETQDYTGNFQPAQPDDQDQFNPHFTMEILDPSEGAPYTITDNTFATNDDFRLPEQNSDAGDQFQINPDLFKTGQVSSFVYPGSGTPKQEEPEDTPFRFGAEDIPEDALPLPENNIYDDIYGDDRQKTAEGDDASFSFDLLSLPDDDEIKREGSLDEYLAEHPEEAASIPSPEDISPELKELQQMFDQEGFGKLPDGFAQSLLDSDLLSKTPEELEAIIRAGGQIPPQESEATANNAQEFSWDFLPPDALAGESEGNDETPSQAAPFTIPEGFTFDEETPLPAGSAAEQDTAPFHLNIPASSDEETGTFPDFGELTDTEEVSGTPGEGAPSFHLHLPGDSEEEPAAFPDFSTEKDSSSEAGGEEPAPVAGDIYTEEPPFHLSLPPESREEQAAFPDFITQEEPAAAPTDQESVPAENDIYTEEPPFHLSLPEDFNAAPSAEEAVQPGEADANELYPQDLLPLNEHEDPFAPFQVRITGETSSAEVSAPAESEVIGEPEAADTGDIPEPEETAGEWSGWNFTGDPEAGSSDQETPLPDGDIYSAESEGSPEEFEVLEPQRDEAELPDLSDETPPKERGSLLNTLFGKSTASREKQPEQQMPPPEDEQSGEYIWDFEKNEFVKLEPGKIEEAIPEKTGPDKQDFSRTLADEAPPEPRSTAMTGEFTTADFVWDPEKEEFVSVAEGAAEKNDLPAEDDSDADLTAGTVSDLDTFSPPAITGEVVTADFIWDPDKQEFVSASELEPVSSPNEEEFQPEQGSDFSSFDESREQEHEEEEEFRGFSSQDSEDIFKLPVDFASGDFSQDEDIYPPHEQNIQEDFPPDETPAEDEAIEETAEGGLWDFSDEEETPQKITPPVQEQSEPLPQRELKLPALNFLDDSPAGGNISSEELPADALEQVKSWIDTASDHDLMNLLSTMGKAFETNEQLQADQDSASHTDSGRETEDIYKDTERTLRDTMENTSNQDNKKSLRSLFKVVSEKTPPPELSEPQNVFDAGDAFWGTPEDTAEKESFLQEDSTSADQSMGAELGNEFTSPDTPAAFIKRNEPDFKTPLKKTSALDSVQMSSDREHSLSEEQLRMIIEAAKTVNSNVKLDEALTTIVVTASNLTKADRGTLYIVDRETDELWSKVMKGEQIEEIRLKIGQGISGWVARSGEILNLKNAYEDARFEASFDSITGYKTSSMLCYPIKDKHNNVIAVLQLLNSHQGTFSRLDEEMISALSSFIGITIQNAELIEGMVQGDRLNSLGKVANFIISDIKKPILTIKHLAEHLRTKKDLPRDVRSVLKMILDQSIIVGDLILTTLNYSQGKVILNKKLAKINSVLDEILGMLQDAIEYKKVQIFKKYDRDVFVMVDRKELYQAFFQITKNACDAMPGGGKLQVTTKVIDEDGTIEISFKDSGMGIPDAIKEKLFEPFFSQGKKNGIGLGLPITEKIIREHGGTISVESELGSGANFVITLPQVTRVG